MEIIIITILILVYLIFKDYSYQKEMRNFLSLMVFENKDIKPKKKDINILNKILNKKEIKNDLEEVKNTYIPLEEVPKEDVEQYFEGSEKK